MPEPRSRLTTAVVLLAAAYVAAQMLSDISSLKITEVAGFSMDAGTLVYPFTFTLRDLVHKVAGKQAARALIFAAAAINVFMAGLFWVVDRLPAVPDVGPQTDMFGAVLSPVWRIVFASILAEVLSELIDTEAYSRWVARFGSRYQWGRVLSSNLVSVPIDSALFVLVAFAGVLTWGNVGETFVTNVVVKLAVTLVSIPWIYLVKPGLGAGPDQPAVSGETRP